MKGGRKHFYCFKSFRLDVEERQLLYGTTSIALTPKAFDLLALLVKRNGHLVGREEMLESIWANSFVEEQNITRTVHTLRRALGEDDSGHKFIETVARKGYRFVAEVTEALELDDPYKGVGGATTGTEVSPRPAESAILVGPIPSDTSGTPPEPATEPRQRRRIIFVGVGLLSAVCLFILLFFNLPRGAVQVPRKVRSIAILPVKALTPGKGEPLYELGIADSLILKLSLASGLVVRPLSATRQYVDIGQDAIAAGKEQQVEYVLVSNYQIADGKFRITSQLINVKSGTVEGVFRDDQENLNGFALQDAVAANVGQLVLRKLHLEPNSVAVKRHTSNEEAYWLYLQGAALADKATTDDVRKAIVYFERAVQLDPNYALAYARSANAQTTVTLNGVGDTQEQYLKAKTAIGKSLAIDNDLAEAHSYLGEIRSDFEGDFVGAEREHRRAIELNANSSIAHRMYSILLSHLARHDESIAESKTAIDLEPASAMNHLIFGRALLFARRYDEAIIALERTAEMDPNFFFAHQSLSVAYRLKGDNDRAFECFLRTRLKIEEGPEEINLWKAIYANAGWQGVLRRQLDRAMANEGLGKPNYNLLANLSVELGEREQAFAYLDKALVERRTITTLKVHPRFDSLRSDPRFDALLKRAGLK